MTKLTLADEDALKKKWIEEQQKTDSLKNPSKTPYVVMIVIMVSVVTLSIVLLETFSPIGKDNSATVLQIIGFAATTTAGLFAYQKSQDTHVMVNSRLSAWMTEAKASSHAEGEIAGRVAANIRTDELAATAATAAPPVGTVALQVKMDTVPLKMKSHKDGDKEAAG
jgi:low temperature requirement protein LtrA